MYFALLVSQLPQVRESHHYHEAAPALVSPTPTKPSHRWSAAVRALLGQKHGLF